jgi:hypothetical protein
MKMVDKKGGQKLNKVDRKVDRNFKMILKAKNDTQAAKDDTNN